MEENLTFSETQTSVSLWWGILEFQEFTDFPSDDIGNQLVLEWIASDIDIGNATWEQIYASLIEKWISLNWASYAGKDGYIFIKLASGDILIFWKNEVSGAIEQVQKSPEEVMQEIFQKEAEKIGAYAKNQRILEGIMSGIEIVFQNNSQEWFGYIDETDVLPIDTSKFPWSDIPEVVGKTSLHITKLQKLARNYFEITKALQTEIDPEKIDIKQKKAMSWLEEKYLDYIIGIGSTYEGGSRAFAENEDGSENVTQTEIENSIQNIVANKSISECFSYMIRKHAQIEANNGQSTENTRTYEAWNKTLNKAVLEKMKTEKSSDKIFLQYAKLVSGRDVPELVASVQHDLQYGEEISSHSLDTNLFDPESASEALLYVFGREGGIFSKIEDKIEINDPKIPETSDCSHIVKNAVETIGKKVEGFDGESARGILWGAGFQDVLDLPVGTKYSELSLDKKMKLSILVRMSEKLQAKSEKIPWEEFGSIFLEIAKEWQQAVIAWINDNFDGGFLWFGSKDSTDMGLDWLDAEIFDLYNDIWGNGGLFDLSDMSIEWVRFGAIVGASIIATIALTLAVWALAPVAVWSLTASVITASIAGTAVSRVATMESFDSSKDFAVDLITDLGTAILFWYLWGKLTEKTFSSLKEVGMKRLTSTAWWKHSGAIALDVWILWIWTEIARNFIIRNPELANGVWIDSIEWKNRFIYEDFHNYVALNLDSYLGKSS